MDEATVVPQSRSHNNNEMQRRRRRRTDIAAEPDRAPGLDRGPGVLLQHVNRQIDVRRGAAAHHVAQAIHRVQLECIHDSEVEPARQLQSYHWRRRLGRRRFRCATNQPTTSML